MYSTGHSDDIDAGVTEIDDWVVFKNAKYEGLHRQFLYDGKEPHVQLTRVASMDMDHRVTAKILYFASGPVDNKMDISCVGDVDHDDVEYDIEKFMKLNLYEQYCV